MRIKWDTVGSRLYETGVDHGVLYIQGSDGEYDSGEAWNGLTSVSENPDGAEANPQYADNIKYLNLISVEELKGTIEAFTYPESFAACDGTAEPLDGVYVGQQRRVPFGLTFRTILGNDTDQNDYGYKLHLIYGAIAQPSERTYETVNDSPEAMTFSWEYETTPVEIEGLRPSASLTIDSTRVDATKLKTLEDVLYGTADKEPRLPLPEEVMEILE